MTHIAEYQMDCPHCRLLIRPLIVGELEMCPVCSEDINQESIAYKPMNTPFTEQNNILTCHKGHSYSFHTIEARNLRMEGVCQHCVVERNRAKAESQSVDAMAVTAEMDEDTANSHSQLAEELAAELVQTLTPMILGKVVNPEYVGDIRLRKRVAKLEKEIEMLRKWGEPVGVDRADSELERLWGRDWRKGLE